MNPQMAQAVGVMAQAVAERLFDRGVMPDVVGKIAEETYKAIQAAPVRRFEVQRRTPKGIILQQISLPEALAEVADQLHISNAIAVQQLEATLKLTKAVLKNNKVCTRILKQSVTEDED